MHRSVVFLSSLRKESVSVLYYLGVFIPHYDADDLYAGPVPDRPRILRSAVVPRYPPGYMVPPHLFQPGYDIDDFAAKPLADEIAAEALAWRDRVRECRNAAGR